jgi:hypothetical protein
VHGDTLLLIWRIFLDMRMIWLSSDHVYGVDLEVHMT